MTQVTKQAPQFQVGLSNNLHRPKTPFQRSSGIGTGIQRTEINNDYSSFVREPSPALKVNSRFSKIYRRSTSTNQQNSLTRQQIARPATMMTRGFTQNSRGVLHINQNSPTRKFCNLIYFPPHSWRRGIPCLRWTTLRTSYWTLKSHFCQHYSNFFLWEWNLRERYWIFCLYLLEGLFQVVEVWLYPCAWFLSQKTSLGASRLVRCCCLEFERLSMDF